MTEHSTDSPTGQPVDPNGKKNIINGRYLYCLVDPTASEEAKITVRGVGDVPVYLIQERDVSAVVHDCERTYGTETPDLDLLKQRVLRHQRVVDAASESFGTPLPMRFNTVFDGGNASLRGWMQDQYGQIRGGLRSFAGMREYRVSLFWESESFEEKIKTQDETLRGILQRQQQAGSGKAFLIEKQYNKRLRELKNERREELTAALKRAVKPTARELQEQESTTPLSQTPDSADGEVVAHVAILADKTDEAKLGDRLDEFVEHDGASVRFTGPWPPYTFVPDLG